MQRCWILSLTALLLLVGLCAPMRSARVAASDQSQVVSAKKKCKTIVKKHHSKTTKRRVCTVAKPKPTHPPVPTYTPTATATVPPTSGASPSLFADPNDRPLGIAVDAQGNVYIGLACDSSVLKLSSSGQLLSRWAWPRTLASGCEPAQELKVDVQGNVWGTSTYAIVELSPTGKVLGDWRTDDQSTIGLSFPQDLAIDGQGNVYVADTGDAQVAKLSPTFQPMTTWSTSEAADDPNAPPSALAIDRMGDVYAALIGSGGEDKIVEFSPSGSLLTRWNLKGGTTAAHYSIALDSHDNLFVADHNNRLIQKFTGSGQLLTQWGNKANDPGQLSGPEALAIDPEGNVLATDARRVLKFSPDGHLLAVWT